MEITTNFTTMNRPNFGINKPTPSTNIPKRIINRYGINLRQKEGFKDDSFKKAPDTLSKNLKSFFDNLGVDWRKRIDPTKKRRRFE